MARRSFQQPSTLQMPIVLATGTPASTQAIPPICQHIRHCRERMGMDQGELASRVGVTANAVSNWERGRARPDISLLPVLCDVFGISLYELYGLRDPYRKTTAGEEQLIDGYRLLSPAMQQVVDDLVSGLIAAQTQSRPTRVLTEYNHTLAAGVSFADEYDDPGIPVTVYTDLVDSRADCIFTVNGDSMSPTYAGGDRVLVERLYRADALRPGEIGAFAEGNDLWIKEYQQDGLYSHNRRYAPMRFDGDTQIVLIGRVLGRLDSAAIAPAVRHAK